MPNQVLKFDPPIFYDAECFFTTSLLLEIGAYWSGSVKTFFKELIFLSFFVSTKFETKSSKNIKFLVSNSMLFAQRGNPFHRHPKGQVVLLVNLVKFILLTIYLLVTRIQNNKQGQDWSQVCGQILKLCNKFISINYLRKYKYMGYPSVGDNCLKLIPR